MLLNKHITHVDEYPFENNACQGIDSLTALVYKLSGIDSPHVSVSTKYDGAPSVVFGIHPDNYKLFCGTKSVFDKTAPKIAYSEKDIQEMYGDKKELSEKLRMFFFWLDRNFKLGNLRKGVYQGDLMFTADSIVEFDNIMHFTPNTITYCCSTRDDIAHEIAHSQVGVALHTRYTGETFSELYSDTKIDYNTFSNHESMCWIDPNIDLNLYQMNDLQKAVCNYMLDKADQLFSTMEYSPVISRHGDMLKMFIDLCIKIGETDPSFSMYTTFLKNRNQLELYEEAMTMKHVSIIKAMAMQWYLAYVKKIIINVLDEKSMFFHEVNGENTSGEGYVLTYHGVQSKLVDRIEYNRKTLANKRVSNAN